VSTAAAKSLTGHATRVFKLKFFNDFIFLSAALNDRILNAWSSSENGAVASFVCSDAPTFVDICTLAAAQQQEEEEAAAAAAIIAVVTSKGHLILFQHYFQSKNKKKTKSKAPIKSWKRIQIESDSGSPLKILAAFFYSFQDQESILIIYGSSLSPTIEKINMSDLKSSNDKDVIILIRLDPDQTSVALQREVNKIETPLVAKELKVFAPAAAAAVASKRKSTEPTQVSTFFILFYLLLFFFFFLKEVQNSTQFRQ
jgi:hypothetical protein